MLVKTKFFGEVDLPEEKIITFERGLIGLADYKKFTILYDCEKEDSNISWLQSVEEPTLALPVVKPWIVKEDYNPVVEDELLSHIGELTEENLVILVTMTVPEQIERLIHVGRRTYAYRLKKLRQTIEKEFSEIMQDFFQTEH